MIIWVDIDEVIAETLDFVLKFHNYQIAWKPLKREQFSSYYIPNIPGYEDISKEQAVSFFTDGMRYSAEHWGIQPVLWAKEALKQAKKQGHTLYAITARGPLVQPATEKRIKDYYPNIFEEIIFCNYHDTTKPQFTKEEMCQKYWIHLMIDDNLEYARAIANSNIRVLLIDNPRNQEYSPEKDPLITKVKNRSEIHFDK